MIYPEEIRGNERETLFCSAQLRENNVQVDDCPHKYGGSQCLLIKGQGEEDVLIPLTYSKGISILACEEPTTDEIASLPVFDIIDPTGVWNSKGLPTEEFNLQLCNEVLALREQRRARAANRPPGSIWDASDIALWQTRLGYAPSDVTKKTLEVTTQMVDLGENKASYSIMKDHFKKKFPGLGCKRVEDVAFCDLFQPAAHTGASKQGYNYYLLIGLGRNKTVHGYGLKTKDEAPDALTDYFRDVCVPSKVVTDGAGELTGAPWI